MTAPQAVNGAPPAAPAPADVIRVGEATAAAAARLLEQQLAVVWTALLEQAGASPDDGWALRIGDLTLVRVGRAPERTGAG